MGGSSSVQQQQPASGKGPSQPQQPQQGQQGQQTSVPQNVLNSYSQQQQPSYGQPQGYYGRQQFQQQQPQQAPPAQMYNQFQQQQGMQTAGGKGPQQGYGPPQGMPQQGPQQGYGPSPQNYGPPQGVPQQAVFGQGQNIPQDVMNRYNQVNQPSQGPQLGYGPSPQYLGTSDGSIVTPQAPEAYTGTGTPYENSMKVTPESLALQKNYFENDSKSQAMAMEQNKRNWAENEQRAKTAPVNAADAFSRIYQTSLGQPFPQQQQGAGQLGGLPQQQGAGGLRGLAAMPPKDRGMFIFKRGGAIGHYADGGDVVAPGMSLLMMERK